MNLGEKVLGASLFTEGIFPHSHVGVGPSTAGRNSRPSQGCAIIDKGGGKGGDVNLPKGGSFFLFHAGGLRFREPRMALGGVDLEENSVFLGGTIIFYNVPVSSARREIMKSHFRERQGKLPAERKEGRVVL